MSIATQQSLDSEMNPEQERDHPLVFFDGVCGLCNSTVDFLIKRDHNALLRFAPLQGDTARAQLDAEDTQHLGSVVLQQDGKTFRHSTAVTRMLWLLGGWWRIAGAMLWLIPWPIRHLGYKAVAALRYKFFPAKRSCRLPTPEESHRFHP